MSMTMVIIIIMTIPFNFIGTTERTFNLSVFPQGNPKFWVRGCSPENELEWFHFIMSIDVAGAQKDVTRPLGACPKISCVTLHGALYVPPIKPFGYHFLVMHLSLGIAG